MNTKELLQLLSARYCPPAYAFLENVRNGTGYGSRDGVRTADAMSMGLWPSRGLYLTGYELKVSRTDWLKEYKSPEKADAIAKYCDFWYLVVPDMTIIQTGELPPTWGLLAVQNYKLHVVKEATLLEAEPLSKLFLCSILRNVTENWFPSSTLEVKMKDKLAVEKSHWESQKSYREKEMDKLWDRVRKFEEATGIDIESQWRDIGKIGEAVNTVMQGTYKQEIKSLELLRERAKDILENTEEAIAELNKLDSVSQNG